jgi:hypothetical protein
MEFQQKISRVAVAITLKSMAIGLVFGLFVPSALWAQSALDNPPNGSVVSGISIISGWKCTAGVITFTIDNGPPGRLVHGVSRGDTTGVCQNDGDNGFIAQFNWNLVGAGQHTIQVFDDGAKFAEATFNVASTGQEFLSGRSGTATAEQFPEPDLDTFLTWQENLQNFVITGGSPHVPSGGQKCEEHFILSVTESGRFVKLENNEVWEVDQFDRFDTSLWLPADDVLLCDLNSDFGNQRTMIDLDQNSGNIAQVSM